MSGASESESGYTSGPATSEREGTKIGDSAIPHPHGSFKVSEFLVEVVLGSGEEIADAVWSANVDQFCHKMLCLKKLKVSIRTRDGARCLQLPDYSCILSVRPRPWA